MTWVLVALIFYHGTVTSVVIPDFDDELTCNFVGTTLRGYYYDQVVLPHCVVGHKKRAQ